MDGKKEVARLHKRVSAWLENWLTTPVLVENHRDEPTQTLNDYLNGTAKVRRLGSRAQYLHFWHLIQYENAQLNQAAPSWDQLALSARYAEAYIHFETAFSLAGKNGSILQDSAAMYFSMVVIAGWENSAKKLGRVLIDGLNTSLLDLQITAPHKAGTLYRHFWFVMHLYEKAFDCPIDVKKYSYPDDMNPYQPVLNDWKTTDLKKVSQWVDAMADFHLQETQNTAHDEIDEFDKESQMLFPYEILCWLRLREWQGLSNPASFNHPLMQQPLALMPTSSPLPIPDIPLLDAVVERFRLEFPASFT